ncbi:hypothetical protein JQ595_16615 [Bradyrhizobium japonicum]|uniref:hypothetical protein n=1 Tax=Bradyrhizobium japonicum TaxID=375 RepID=UPI001BAA5DF3|nr:hypothetical protein [Bradyrhizobium japonicum]MBR0730376.1 hypothetical protein [Bradyrhizobium japonicum]
MISLSDDEMAIMMDAARPIHPRERNAFLDAVAVELAKYSELGPGIVARVCAQFQRKHLAPRIGHNVVGKYD